MNDGCNHIRAIQTALDEVQKAKPKKGEQVEFFEEAEAKLKELVEFAATYLVK